MSTGTAKPKAKVAPSATQTPIAIPTAQPTAIPTIAATPSPNVDSIKWNPFSISDGWGWQVGFQLVLAYITLRITIWATRKGLIEGSRINEIQARINALKENLRLRISIAMNLKKGTELALLKVEEKTEFSWDDIMEWFQRAYDFSQTHKEKLDQTEMDYINKWPAYKQNLKDILFVGKVPKIKTFTDDMNLARTTMELRINKFGKELHKLTRLMKKIKRKFRLF